MHLIFFVPYFFLIYKSKAGLFFLAYKSKIRQFNGSFWQFEHLALGHFNISTKVN